MGINRTLNILRLRVRGSGSDDSGMSTAEYAVGTVAACGFAGVLFKVVTSSAVAGALRDLIQRALTTAF
jgi:hypothetical protein